LIGLSVELSNSGVTNRHENAWSCRVASAGTAVQMSPCAPGSVLCDDAINPPSGVRPAPLFLQQLKITRYTGYLYRKAAY
jgi:hypothetical protein